ncbi:MAG: TIGR04222 domain-containing membrane protein [Bryobacteraceae bacterium]
MNPFHWSGPSFLLFYFLFGASVILVVWLRNHEVGEEAASGELNLSDPYEIAYLRGGAREVILVAIVKLLQAGVLEQSLLDSVVTVSEPPGGSSPLEREIAGLARTPAAPEDIADRISLQVIADEYRPPLEARGLIHSDESNDNARWRIGLAATVLLMIAVARVAQGLMNHKPVLFLVILAIVSLVALCRVGLPGRRTAKGDSTLWAAESVFAQQREPVADASAAEMALTAAVFGLWALPLVAFPNRDTLFRRSAQSRNRGDGANPPNSSGCGAFTCGSAHSGGGSSCGSGSSCGGSGGCGGCGGGN